MAIGQSQMTELALREVAQNFLDDEFTLDNAKKNALSRISQLIHGSENVKQHLNGVGWQEGVVALAIGGIAFAYRAGSEQLKILGRKRLDFDKELAAGNATFLIPANVEKNQLAREQGGMAAYISLVQGNPAIFRYMGIKEKTLDITRHGVEGTFLSSLPYYEMSRQLPESLSTDSPSEKIRQSITRFFRTQMKFFLKDIDNDFTDNSQFVDFFRSKWQGDNFLNNFRSPRLIIMSLGNLLWNLQHPIDPETKYPLTLIEKVSLCEQAGELINELLNKASKENKKGCENYLDMIDPTKELSSFVRMIEIYNQELQEAYEEERSNSLNLKEVSTHAHRAARLLNENIFRMIYKKDNQAESLASYIDSLFFLLKRDNKIINVLDNYKHVRHPLKNDPPRTLMDLLLVFCQLDKYEVEDFLQSLNGTGKSLRKSFALRLQGLYKKFIYPLYKAERTELQKEKYGGQSKRAINKLKEHWNDKIKSEAVQRGFYQSLSLIAMAVNDYNIELDTPITKAASLRSIFLDEKPFLTSRKQINIITARAYANSKRKKDEFGCNVSSYLNLLDSSEDKLNELASKQYKIGQYTHLVATLNEFTQKYRDYLLVPSFKSFLKKSLDKINDEFNALAQLCLKLKSEITFAKTDDREIIRVIKKMRASLLLEFSSFKAEVESCTEKMMSESFDQNIRREIMSNISKIDKRFSDAFGKNAPERDDLKEFIKELNKNIQPDPDVDKPVNDADNFDLAPESDAEVVSNINAHQLLKVSSLIFQCYEGLSTSSKAGIKGAELLTLHELFINKGKYKKDDLKKTVQELSKIVCAYRPTYFFQAGYAKTKSANVLVNAMLESIDDKEFPLHDWVFNESNESKTPIGMITNESVVKRLFKLKKEKKWAINTNEFINDPMLKF